MKLHFDLDPFGDIEQCLYCGRRGPEVCKDCELEWLSSFEVPYVGTDDATDVPVEDDDGDVGEEVSRPKEERGKEASL